MSAPCFFFLHTNKLEAVQGQDFNYVHGRYLMCESYKKKLSHSDVWVQIPATTAPFFF